LPVTWFRSPTNSSITTVPDGGRRKFHATQQVVSDLETFKHANVTMGSLQEIAAALGGRPVVESR
jgi:hypothetical protein